MYRFFVCCVLLMLLGCTSDESIPVIQNLETNWSFKSKHGADWYPATVPGNIFTDLLDHQLIKDPFIKNNEAQVQWVSDSTWIYKTTFRSDEHVLQKGYIDLHFEGLDTYADVYLNDSIILFSRNAFRTYSVPVKSILKADNELKIVFKSTAPIEEKEKQQLGYELPEGNRVFTRKAQFQYGWDWGPKLNTSGIWKRVYLKAWDNIRFSSVYTKLSSLTDDNAALINELSIVSDKDQSVLITTTVDGTSYDTTLDLKKGQHQYSIPLHIQNPKLWWPHNLGTPFLYDLHFDIVSHGKVLDSKKVKFGVRTIELVNKKDSIGESFYFKVNGIPVYMKGANYIPQNSFQNKVSNTHYEKLLDDVVDANMNMLRVWGGGIYENDIFYQLCDEKGILIWQDFMFACAMYPGDQRFLNNIQEEATDQVKRLRNHASIALWAGNNENSEGWHRWGWQHGRSESEKKEIWDHYLKVFDSILPNTVRALSQTSYWESSPKYGRGNPLYKTEGDAHDWWVWHDGYPFEHFEKNVPRFMSEFGFQSFPSYPTIQYINQKDSIDIHTKAISAHQKHSRGFQLIHEYMKRDYPVPLKDEDYIYVSQLVQARGITKGIEAHRRAKPYNMGTLFWQLNDCWPAISWSSIDYFGNWKALHYQSKKSFENVIISSEINENKISFYLVNDLSNYAQDTIRLRVIDFEGNEQWAFTKEIQTQKKTGPLLIGVFSLEDVFKNPKASVLLSSSNTLDERYHYAVKPKDLELSKIPIEYKTVKVKEGFQITLTSGAFQKDVFLSSTTKGHFSDNFFDMPPNREVKVIFKTDATSLEKLLIKSLHQVNP